ncbi:hypothetical protein WMY93_021469 [Mugilogobius chulae]|uniref:Uncharacterized protein n=1 Tax=Mugilogobius chulae TaxID=88201 RepID=A0AAW0NFF5_9GOBI
MLLNGVFSSHRRRHTGRLLKGHYSGNTLTAQSGTARAILTGCGSEILSISWCHRYISHFSRASSSSEPGRAAGCHGSVIMCSYDGEAEKTFGTTRTLPRADHSSKLSDQGRKTKGGQGGDQDLMVTLSAPEFLWREYSLPEGQPSLQQSTNQACMAHRTTNVSCISALFASARVPLLRGVSPPRTNPNSTVGFGQYMRRSSGMLSYGFGDIISPAYEVA